MDQAEPHNASFLSASVFDGTLLDSDWVLERARIEIPQNRSLRADILYRPREPATPAMKDSGRKIGILNSMREVADTLPQKWHERDHRMTTRTQYRTWMVG